jgi:hypothetical protein
MHSCSSPFRSVSVGVIGRVIFQPIGYDWSEVVTESGDSVSRPPRFPDECQRGRDPPVDCLSTIAFGICNGFKNIVAQA